MNIYLHELKVNRKFMIYWSIGILAIIFIYGSFYPLFIKEVDNFVNLMNQYPAEIRAIFGFNGGNIKSILGYFSTFTLSFATICGSILAMILGLSIISKEEKEKTADFLLAKPVSRFKILTAKILATLTLLLISNSVIYIITYFFLILVANTTINLTIFTLLFLTILIIQLLFLTLGFFISVILKKVKAVLAMAMGIVFGFYFFSVFAAEKLRLLMPFNYFDANYIIKHSSYESLYLGSTFLLIIIFISLSYYIYQKKDIASI
ncbi:MAG: ABC transporter permease subunit [Bacilli bacterium]|nr:ABC transporter permease subunit [Bacilli bacterium]